MSNGILQPGKMGLSVSHHDGPMANPVSLPVQETGGVHIHTFGGLTKLETVAAQIAAGLAANSERMPEEAAELSVELAEQVLAICQQRETQEKPAEQPN